MKIPCICRNCGESYSLEDIKPEGVEGPWISGYCSAKCVRLKARSLNILTDSLETLASALIENKCVGHITTQGEIKLKDVLEYIENSNGKIFSIRFIKRTTSEERQMRCRTGVTSKLKGGERAYDFEEKKLVSVYDMDKEDYRVIPIENITEFKSNGEWLAVVQPKRK